MEQPLLLCDDDDDFIDPDHNSSSDNDNATNGSKNASDNSSISASNNASIEETCLRFAWADLVQAYESSSLLDHGLQVTDLNEEEGSARLLVPRGTVLKRAACFQKAPQDDQQEEEEQQAQGRVVCLWKLPFTLQLALPLFIQEAHPKFEVELVIGNAQSL